MKKPKTEKQMVTKESISVKFYFMCVYGGLGPPKAFMWFWGDQWQMRWV